MSVIYFLLVLSAVASTMYYINYRLVVAIKMLINKEWLQVLDTSLMDEEQFKHSVTRINGFTKELDQMETKCFIASSVSVLSWSIILFLKLF